MPTFDWTHVIETLIGTLSGAVIAAFFAWWLPRKFGKRLSERQEQERILRQIIISKTDIERLEYVKCLSYIELTFSKHKDVLDAWRILSRLYENPEPNNENYLEEKRSDLIRAIAKVLGYDNEVISQLLGRRVYKPIWLQQEQQIEQNRRNKEMPLNVIPIETVVEQLANDIKKIHAQLISIGSAIERNTK